MSKKLPEPPIDRVADLRDFRFMPLDVIRLKNSDIVGLASGEEFRAAVLLWCAAWHQVPAGSLPDDDRQLARFAECGRDLEAFQAIKGMAMRGFQKCSDGRLYHAVICREASLAWERKSDAADAREAERQRKRAMRRKKADIKQNPRPKDNSGTSAGSPAGRPPEFRSMTGTGTGTSPLTPGQEFDRKEVAAECFRLAGLEPEQQKDFGSSDYHLAASWLNAGAVPDRHIYPTIENIMERSGAEPRSLRYFHQAITEAIENVPATPAANGHAQQGPTVEQRYPYKIDQDRYWSVCAWLERGGKPEDWYETLNGPLEKIPQRIIVDARAKASIAAGKGSLRVDRSEKQVD